MAERDITLRRINEVVASFATMENAEANEKRKCEIGKLSTPSVALLLVTPVSGGQSVTPE